MDPLQNLFDEITRTGSYAFDVEHDPNIGPHHPAFKLTGCTFWSGNVGYYLKNPVNIRRVTDKLFNEDWEAVGHNVKYDIICLAEAGLCKDYPKVLVDTMIAENVLNDELHPNEIGLKPTVLRRYNVKMMDFEDAVAFGPESAEFEAYALSDGQWDWKLWQDQRKELEAQGLLKYVLKVPALKPIADMERAGMHWSLSVGREQLRSFRKVRDRLEEEVYKEIGYLNLGSTQQLSKRLFEDMGISHEGLDKTATGKVCLDAENLEKLATRCDAAKKIVNYRSAVKMSSTYVEPFTADALADPEQRVRGHYWLVSSTGRTRCSAHNLQNVPTRLDPIFGGIAIREGFAAPPGKKIIVCDLSQIELRMIAHFTGDPSITKAYTDWQCRQCGGTGTSLEILHDCPDCGADENEEILTDPKAEGFWHGLDLHAITAEKVQVLAGDRKMGKTCNFALVYGASAWRMHYAHPTVSVDAWEEIIRQFMFDAYPQIPVWHAAVERELNRSGIIKDIFGRRRRIPRKVLQQSYKHCLNQAINFGPQSSACGLAQIAMQRIRNHLLLKGWNLGRAKLVNFVHDEIVAEADEALAEEVRDIIVSNLETAVKLKVPVRSSSAIVANWADGK